MPLSWTQKRQLFFFGIFAVFVILVAIGIIFYLKPAPSCFDKKQNQGEEGVDCAGPCKSCLEGAKDLVVFWTRAFPIAPGHYEVASLAENPNLLLGTDKLTYRVRLYDSNNILIALKEGRTFLNPREKFLIFEEDIETRERVPIRATIEIKTPEWKRLEKERPQFLVVRKDFGNVPQGRLRVTLRNQSLFPVKDIFVSAILLDKDGNALGVSTSKISEISGEGEREVVFTWRHPFDPPPAAIEVLARTNLTGRLDFGLGF